MMPFVLQNKKQSMFGIASIQSILKLLRQTNPERKPTMNNINQILAYENGELDEAGVIELFQSLVSTGLAWSLQGSYGRTAKALIEAGLVTV
jgi:hypothetical protein